MAFLDWNPLPWLGFIGSFFLVLFWLSGRAQSKLPRQRDRAYDGTEAFQERNGLVELDRGVAGTARTLDVPQDPPPAGERQPATPEPAPKVTP